MYKKLVLRKAYIIRQMYVHLEMSDLYLVQKRQLILQDKQSIVV